MCRERKRRQCVHREQRREDRGLDLACWRCGDAHVLCLIALSKLRASKSDALKGMGMDLLPEFMSHYHRFILGQCKTLFTLAFLVVLKLVSELSTACAVASMCANTGTPFW
jgi:hypothetical protein